MAIFGPNPWVSPFGKISSFRLFERLVFIAKKNVFSFQNMVKHIFLAYIAKKKKKKQNNGKMVIFAAKPWVNPFCKMSIFQLFEILVVIAKKGFFLFQNMVKHIFLVYIALKKLMEKRPFLDQNNELTPLVKCRFFHLLNFLYLQPRKAFFSFQNIIKTFSRTIQPKKKFKTMAIFRPKQWKNVNFSTF